MLKKIISNYKKGASFSELAKKYSKDKFYAKKGGDIGWIKKGYMMKEIDEAIFTHKKGDILSIKAPEWGWTIILITESPIINEYAELLIVKK
ncbi:peptidylprolyl isomerase [Aquimarina agarivorans]|uniref:peptidylprolyl isomerase n=1 Tax=Aquimarina agarivorans TaxID=980584 RepID=UPI000248E676|nr:peptidylprolyl isomerase [Aquimarina agarivorans]